MNFPWRILVKGHTDWNPSIILIENNLIWRHWTPLYISKPSSYIVGMKAVTNCWLSQWPPSPLHWLPTPKVTGLHFLNCVTVRSHITPCYNKPCHYAVHLMNKMRISCDPDLEFFSLKIINVAWLRGTFHQSNSVCKKYTANYQVWAITRTTPSLEHPLKSLLSLFPFSISLSNSRLLLNCPCIFSPEHFHVLMEIGERRQAFEWQITSYISCLIASF